MSQPPDKYERIFDFTDFSATQPSAQQPGQKIDQELNAARESLNETIDRLGEIQRDDGKLRSSALDTTEFTGIVNAATATATAAASSATASATTATTKASEATSAATTASGAATTATGAAATATAQATIASTSATTANTKAAEAADSAASALTSKNSAFASASSATSSAGSAAGHAADAATAAGNAASSASTATTQANLATAAANSFSLTAGTTTTGAAGSSASVTVTGSAPSYALNITVPAGPAGSTGATGPAGSVGPAGPAGSTGPAGPAGATGATGPAGTAATIGVGTVTTGAAGSSVSITNVGTSSAAVFNFSIPRGDTGATGPQGPAGAGGTWGSISGTLSSQVDLNNALAAKLNVAGGTLTGKLNTLATTTTAAGLNVPHGTVAPSSPVNGDIWSTSAGIYARVNGDTKHIADRNWVFSNNYVNSSYVTSYVGGLTGMPAVQNASKVDYSNTPSTYLIGGDTANAYSYGLLISLAASSYSGWTLNFIQDTSYYYQSNANPNTLDVFYNQYDDLSSIASGLNGLGLPGYGFSYSDDGMGPYYGSLSSSVTLTYPTLGVQPTDRFIFDLEAKMVELAKNAGTFANHVLYFDGSISMAWGRPWTSEGYVTSAMLAGYATLGGANSFSSKQTFVASTSSVASIRITNGSAPSSPVSGDVWSTTAGLFYRANTTTQQLVSLAGGTFTGPVITPAATSSAAGLRATVGVSPTSPVNGDIWTIAAGMYSRVNGHTSLMSACRAFVNFNGTGTVAMRANHNVSSITDNGVGDYTVNFVFALPDANYSTQITTSGFSTTNVAIAAVIHGSTAGATTKTTSALRIQTGSSNTGAVIDMAEIHVAIFR